MNHFPRLETSRLILRELLPADAPALFEIYSDAEAMRWFGADPLTELQQAEGLIDTFSNWRQMSAPGTRWGIRRKSDDKLVGTCGLFKWNRLWNSCFTGFELAQEVRGNGFMMEALSTVLEWGFEHMKLNRVEAKVSPENIDSIKLVNRLGFIQEGYLRQAGFWLGRYHDLIHFAVLRREYPGCVSTDVLEKCA